MQRKAHRYVSEHGPEGQLQSGPAGKGPAAAMAAAEHEGWPMVGAGRDGPASAAAPSVKPRSAEGAGRSAPGRRRKPRQDGNAR